MEIPAACMWDVMCLSGEERVKGIFVVVTRRPTINQVKKVSKNELAWRGFRERLYGARDKYIITTKLHHQLSASQKIAYLNNLPV